MSKTLHLTIHGRVQGVGYRAWMGSRARELGLSGWVRNRREGTVEAVICGAPETVAHMLTDCHQGPPAARVTRVDVKSWEESIPDGFLSRATE